MAVGRIGDLIYGEHYGPPTSVPWGIRYTHPDADVPSGAVAYHPGGLYEIVLALVLLAIVWAAHRRLRAPGALLWTVVGLYAAGRFLIFFYRVDSDDLALGLDSSQWISLLLMAVAAAGLLVATRPGELARARALIRPLTLVAVLAVVSAAITVGGCGGGEEDGLGSVVDDSVIEDPGPVHVHGLGPNPADGALFIATHTGLFRLAEGERKAKRVDGRRYQDTMAFAVIGPDRFLGSGHPDVRQDLPPFLGLIESRDAGRSWNEISLQGEADFHLLELGGKRVYGFGSDFESREERFLSSRDGGRTWRRLAFPEALVSLAVDPADPEHLVATGSEGLYASPDGGRSWRSAGSTTGLLTWPRPERLYLVDQRGIV